MRTILAILAALAIAATARAETEALVTDPSNNVLSQRSGALVFSNDLSVQGAARLSGSGLGFDEAMIFNAEENSLFSVYGDTIATWSYETPQFQLAVPLTFNNPTNAATTRTNLGLGGTNTPTFAGLTLTTLTNATSALVLASTDGTLTTGSVPSGAATLGAVAQADGSGGSSFNLPVTLPTNGMSFGTQTTNRGVVTIGNADNNNGSASVVITSATAGNNGAYFSALGRFESWFLTAASMNTSGSRNMRFGNTTGNLFEIQRLSDNFASITARPFSMANAAPQYSLAIIGSGFVGLGTNTPTAPLDVTGNTIRLRTARTITNSTDAGNPGDMCWDADYFYVAIATNT
jgi:hypothetical protein